jgi:hypothetical protein
MFRATCLVPAMFEVPKPARRVRFTSAMVWDMLHRIACGTNWRLAQGLGGAKSVAFHAHAYGATQARPAAYLAGSLAFANHWMSTDCLAAFADHLTADFDAQSFGGRVARAMILRLGLAGWRPMVPCRRRAFPRRPKPRRPW